MKVKPLEWVKKNDLLYEGKPPDGIWGSYARFRVYYKEGAWHCMEPTCEKKFRPSDTPEEALMKINKYYKSSVMNALDI